MHEAPQSPFNPAAHQLSDHDLLELVMFDAVCVSQGSGCAIEEYAPRFENETLTAAIGCAPLDRLKTLLNYHRKAVDAWWKRPDAVDLFGSYHAARA
ncbi:hypothetical protein [Nocardiopsis sp. LOL_012]|uniref:hypothetical protein n=1 Tax=Nocardiopsis sp. LOL_012 TaxID=3345409 RepID=UPI003A8504DA